MKKIIVFFILMFGFTVCAHAKAPLASDALDELLFIEHQMSSVTTDMYLWFGWLPDDKDGMKIASIKAIADLEVIKKKIQALKCPDDIKSLKNQMLQVISKLQEIYNGVENKDKKKIEGEFAAFNDFYEKYALEVKSALGKYRPFVMLPEGFDPFFEETKLAANDKDRDTYIKANFLMKDKKYAEAYELLLSLKDKYKGAIFENCILLRISDCFNMKDGDMVFANFDPEEVLKMLTGIVDTGKYSPVIFEAFYKWRTGQQEFNHGMSNMSEIPNTEYNKKRWELIQIAKKYLSKNPKDVWAQEQINRLLTLPNIERGGPAGNDNLVHWALLYTGMRKKVKEE